MPPMTEQELINYYAHGIEREIPFEDMMVPRTEWKPNPPLSEGVKKEGPFTIAMTAFTETNPCWNNVTCLIGSRRLQRHYQGMRKFNDLPYNFLITGNGLVFECRGWNQRPILPDRYKRYEPDSFFIGFFGKHLDAGSLSGDMLESRRLLIKMGMDQNYIAKTILYFQLIDKKHTTY